MKTFKIRSSAAGKLMTNPKLKSETLSKTTKTYLQEWTKEQIYGFQKEISSKYLEKGIRLEDEAIDKSITWLDLDMALKNEETFEDEYFTGTPDLILENEIIDIKCSYDLFTFPLFETECPNSDYEAQLQVYMHLTGKKSARVVYLLLNTPDDIAPWESKFNYDDIDVKYRFKAFTVNYDPEVIEKLKERVIESRKYIDSLCAQL